MKSGLPIGASYQESIVVSNAMRAKSPEAFGAQPIHNLLGTAPLIEALEWTSRQLILPYLEVEEEGVGAAIELRHRLAVPVGETIRLESTVVELSERRVKTKIQAWHQDVLVADGSFIQAIVPKSFLTYSQPGEAVSEVVLTTPQTELVDPTASRSQEDTLDVNSLDVPSLHSTNGNYSLSIILLGWESPFPCTLYDEWIQCQITLTSPLGDIRVERPCILRFEVEAIAEGLQRLSGIDRQTPGFQSDFLEPVLQLGMHTNELGELILSVMLNTDDTRDEAIREEKTIKVANQTEKPEPVVFPVSSESIALWCDYAKTRLAQLQALL